MNLQKISDLKDTAFAIAMLNPDSNRHISMILNKKRLISVGTNVGKTHAASLRHGYYNMVSHSELSAFLKVPYTQRSNLTLINFRFNKLGQMRISNPCSVCSIWCDPIFKEIWASQSDGSIRQLK